MIQDIVLETAQAMNALQLSMSYSTAVTELAIDTQETTAQLVSQFSNNPPPVLPMGQIIDTYA